MKINDAFGLKGSLELGGACKINGVPGGLTPNGSGKAAIKFPIPRKLAGKAFEIVMLLEVEYELLKLGSMDFFDSMVHQGKGKFGVVAKWRAMLGDDGLEISAIGSAPAGSSKSEGNISVGVGGALLAQSLIKERSPFVTFEMVLLAGLESQGVGVGYGPVSTTLGGGNHLGKTYPVELTIVFDVEPLPAPKPVTTPIVKVLKFKVGPFEHAKMKSEAVKSSSLSGYYSWADFRNAITKLPQATFDEWESKDPKILGGKTIKITGYADTTGPMSENDMRYAKGRADDVKKWIQTWTGAGDNFFVVKSAGEGKGGTDKKADEKKLAQNRYVEVELSYLQ